MDSLKAYLKQNKIKLYEFGETIGVSQRMIHYYLTFKYVPSLSTAKKISDITKIPILNLLYPEVTCKK